MSFGITTAADMTTNQTNPQILMFSAYLALMIWRHFRRLMKSANGATVRKKISFRNEKNNFKMINIRTSKEKKSEKKTKKRKIKKYKNKEKIKREKSI